MFGILQAVLNLMTASEAHDRKMDWSIKDEPGDGLVLTIRIPVTEDDAEFVQGMQAMFAPVKD